MRASKYTSGTMEYFARVRTRTRTRHAVTTWSITMATKIHTVPVYKWDRVGSNVSTLQTKLTAR